MPDEADASPLRLDIDRRGSLTVVRCRGKLVSGVHNMLYTSASRLIPDSKLIVLDLTQLSQMDSMGLGVLVRLYASAKAAGCDFELINLGKQIRELLGVTNLLSVFPVIGEQRVG